MTTAVNVTRSPAMSVVPAAGRIDSNVMKSVVGPVGVLAPQPVNRNRLTTKLNVLVITNVLDHPVYANYLR